jgi:signal transduction histidine kinase
MAVERERIRIAREIHDGLAADVAGAISLLKLYLQSDGPQADRENTIVGVLGILETQLAATREWLRSMRPDRLGPAHLVEAVRKLADEIGRLHAIRIEVWTSGPAERLSESQREVAYYIVREALNNIRKHSGAAVCRVRMAFDANPFLIEITDEGKGFMTNNGAGYGLVGMRERAAGIGGRLEVVTTLDRGTTVFLFGPT